MCFASPPRPHFPCAERKGFPGSRRVAPGHAGGEHNPPSVRPVFTLVFTPQTIDITTFFKGGEQGEHKNSKTFQNKNIIYRKSCSLCSPYPQTIENTHFLGEHNFCRLCSPPTPPPGSFFFSGNFSGSYHPSTPSLPSRSSQGGFFEFSGTERGNPARFYTLCIPLRWVDQRTIKQNIHFVYNQSIPEHHIPTIYSIIYIIYTIYGITISISPSIHQDIYAFSTLSYALLMIVL